MGVPSFFMWLMRKFPKVVSKSTEENPASWFGYGEKPDLNGPNPNGFEIDNFYLDMNSIIHPCCKPEQGKIPENDSERMIAMFQTLDRLMANVRPRKLVYFAVDGVAPRAKMNQQRSRRFRAAQDSKESLEVERIRKRECEARGMHYDAPPSKFDGNVITPGTDFLLTVSKALRYYVETRQTEDSYWKNLKVIISDGGVPGEGEHKIMDFIRRQRLMEDYNPNTVHVLYGSDADLLMLALVSHEPHFKILRDMPDKSVLNSKEMEGLDPQDHIALARLHFAHIDILREYLIMDLFVPNLPFERMDERVLDDFVFMCFLVGNDFLPHIPSLDIKDGSLDLLMEAYRRNLHLMGGYITGDGMLNLDRAEILIRVIGSKEDTLLHAKTEKQRKMARYRNNGQDGRGKKEEPPKVVDEVRFDIPGWKRRYYMTKFPVESKDIAFYRRIRDEYVRGLCWVWRYYSQGCPSWDWYFPFYYAPFASDLAQLQEVNTSFEPSKPRRPFEQLLGVLPALSGHALPEAYRNLMTDPNSPIIDFYPDTFALDMNGQDKPWKAVVLLPFIDQKRLSDAIEDVDKHITQEEKERNSMNWDLFFVHTSHPLGNFVKGLYEDKTVLPSWKSEEIDWVDINDPTKEIFGTMSGYATGNTTGQKVRSIILGLPDFVNGSASALYNPPIIPEGFVFQSVLLAGTVLPEPTLNDNDEEKLRYGTRDVKTACQILGHHLAASENQGHKMRTQPQNSYSTHSQSGSLHQSGFTRSHPKPYDRNAGPQSSQRPVHHRPPYPHRGQQYQEDPQGPNYHGGSSYGRYEGAEAPTSMPDRPFHMDYTSQNPPPPRYHPMGSKSGFSSSPGYQGAQHTYSGQSSLQSRNSGYDQYSHAGPQSYGQYPHPPHHSQQNPREMPPQAHSYPKRARDDDEQHPPKSSR